MENFGLAQDLAGSPSVMAIMKCKVVQSMGQSRSLLYSLRHPLAFLQTSLPFVIEEYGLNKST